MRLATITLFGMIMMCPAPGYSQSALWDVESVNKGLFNIGIAHGIRKNCDSIKANTLVGISYVWKIIGHATDAGFTLKETREFINNDTEKEVFKTAVEINQSWIVEHASMRQEYVCQSQSVNLFFPPDVNKGDLHNVHMLAWAKNLKTLYYLRSEAISRADNVSSKVKREIIFEQEDCLACEG